MQDAEYLASPLDNILTAIGPFQGKRHTLVIQHQHQHQRLAWQIDSGSTLITVCADEAEEECRSLLTPCKLWYTQPVSESNSFFA